MRHQTFLDNVWFVCSCQTRHLECILRHGLVVLFYTLHKNAEPPSEYAFKGEKIAFSHGNVNL